LSVNKVITHLLTMAVSLSDCYGVKLVGFQGIFAFRSIGVVTLLVTGAASLSDSIGVVTLLVTGAASLSDS
jgi:hypothetical protein